ncbi:unnamed protein product [Closterium sp. NIES-64]|nr:unnamed protein product [Closterium sp. NIES-64]
MATTPFFAPVITDAPSVDTITLSVSFAASPAAFSGSESRHRFLTCSARARKFGAEEVSAERSSPSADAKTAADGENVAENTAAGDTEKKPEDAGKKAEDAGKKAEDVGKKAQKWGKELEKRLHRLREEMAEVDGGKGVNALIIPSEAPHQSEYMAPCFERRTFISGFTGSAGTAMVTREHALLWTNGRYFLQAEQQLPPGWDLMRVGMRGVPSVADWLAEALPAGSRVGVDPVSGMEDGKKGRVGVDPFVHSADKVRGLAVTLAVCVCVHPSPSSLPPPSLFRLQFVHSADNVRGLADTGWCRCCARATPLTWFGARRSLGRGGGPVGAAERPPPPSAPMWVHPIEFAGQTGPPPPLAPMRVHPIEFAGQTVRAKLFPIQTKLVSVELLSDAEVKWINDYHHRVWDTVSVGCWECGMLGVWGAGSMGYCACGWDTECGTLRSVTHCLPSAVRSTPAVVTA